MTKRLCFLLGIGLLSASALAIDPSDLGDMLLMHGTVIYGLDSYDNLANRVRDMTEDQRSKVQGEYEAQGKDEQKLNDELLTQVQEKAGEDWFAKRTLAKVLLAQTMPQRSEMIFKHQLKLRTILTGPQVLKWETWKLREQAAQRFAPAGTLSNEQTAKLDALAVDCAKQIIEAKDVASADAVRSRFWLQGLTTILTPTQVNSVFQMRTTAMPPPAPNPGGGAVG